MNWSSQWFWLACAYFGYLAVVSLVRVEFRRARVPALAWFVAASVLAPMASGFGVVATVVIPGLVLLAGYTLSGWFFVRVDANAERRLLESDRQLLTRTGVLSAYGALPGAVREMFELSYFLVYAAIPAGAATLALSGHVSELGRFWFVVLLAEFVCYGALPWLQVRPPMLLEPPQPASGILRRVNQAIAARASIRAATIPSAHAAGAFATAFVVGRVMPGAGIAFGVLAVTIATASVMGRYHYAADAILGLLVAIGAYLAIG